jgi:peptidoglycan/xylan/chitin deacetylase (PgdA/CDA1 family)
LDYLAKENIKATFFINGVNYFDIRAPRWALLVARMYNEGHQIGLHGWSHADLATLSADGVRQEMKTLDQAIQRIIGVSPRYMRPPFGSVNADTLRVLRDELKYRVILWNIETKDSYHNGDVSQDMQAYQDAFSQPNYEKHGYISLQHDPIPTTVSQLTLQAVALARQKKLKLVTVAECLGDTGKEYWQPSP